MALSTTLTRETQRRVTIFGIAKYCNKVDYTNNMLGINIKQIQYVKYD
jgi:hypothetical protein